MNYPTDDIVEVYRIAGEDWADKEAAASLLEQTKSAVLAQRQSALGDIPVNRAEQTVKASPEWYEHIVKIVEARHQANLAWINLEVINKQYFKQQSSEANQRTEIKMLGGVT